jgi:hypothetical protein
MDSTPIAASRSRKPAGFETASEWSNAELDQEAGAPAFLATSTDGTNVAGIEFLTNASNHASTTFGGLPELA